MSIQERAFTEPESREFLLTPGTRADKYTRGVVGFVTGSAQYPGAAALGVSAALHTGVGMVRFLSEPEPTDLVLNRFPEVVCRHGHADAWVVGSGIDANARTEETTQRMRDALRSGSPCVIDAGALDLISEAVAPSVITPHTRELERLWRSVGSEVTAADIANEPSRWAVETATRWQVCVLLKGHTTVLAIPNSSEVVVPPSGSEWLSTAGTGDVLAGAIGAVLASIAAHRRIEHPESKLRWSEVRGCAATGATLHAHASRTLPTPFTAMELAIGLRASRAALV